MTDSAHEVSEATRKVDILFDTMVELTAQVRRVCEVSEGRNVQTVIHKSTGMGPWGAAAVVACFATWFGILAILLWTIPEIHDLRAWQDILRKDVSRIQASQK